MLAANPPTLLFSVDTEEFYSKTRDACPGSSYEELLGVYLGALGEKRIRGTFFVVGSFARKFPQVIHRIHSEGHEIACHTDTHKALNLHSPESFKEDLAANIDTLRQLIGADVVGFRAPIFSLDERTAWAYEVMAELGIQYSSSVLPAKSPLFGWPDFGSKPRIIKGVVEIPMSVEKLPMSPHLPMFGGTYFRVLPYPVIRTKAKRHPGDYITSYFHPYDIDHRQGWTMSEGVNDSRILNLLLFLRRKSTPVRIRRFLALFNDVSTYRNYADHWRSRQSAH